MVLWLIIKAQIYYPSMSPDEIGEFSRLWAFHPPIAIGAFLIFVIIYRSKFFSHKAQLTATKSDLTNQTEEAIRIEEITNDSSP